MRKTIESYLKEAVDAAARQNVAQSIWLIENAKWAASDDDQAIISEYARQLHISDDQLRSAVVSCSSHLKTVLAILSHPDNLSSEEWMLVVSEISGAYSVKLFAESTGREIDLPQFDLVMKQLEDATGHFNHPGFLRQIEAARRRYPNPLPPPL